MSEEEISLDKVYKDAFQLAVSEICELTGQKWNHVYEALLVEAVEAKKRREEKKKEIYRWYNLKMYEEAIKNPAQPIDGVEIEGSLQELLEVATQMGYETEYEQGLNEGNETCFYVWGWTNNTPKNDLDWCICLIPKD